MRRCGAGGIVVAVRGADCNCGSGPLVFGGVSLRVKGNVCKLLKRGNMNGAALVRLVYKLLFPGGKGYDVSKEGATRERPRKLGHCFFLPRRLRVPARDVTDFTTHRSMFCPRFGRRRFRLGLRRLGVSQGRGLSSVSCKRRGGTVLTCTFTLRAPCVLLSRPAGKLSVASHRTLGHVVDHDVSSRDALLVSARRTRSFRGLLSRLVVLNGNRVLLGHSLSRVDGQLLFTQADVLPRRDVCDRRGLSNCFSVVPGRSKRRGAPSVRLLCGTILRRPRGVRDVFR